MMLQNSSLQYTVVVFLRHDGMTVDYNLEIAHMDIYD